MMGKSAWDFSGVRFIWQKSPQEIAKELEYTPIPGAGAIGSISGKAAALAIGGTIAGAAAVSYFGGKGQQQALEQTGTALSKPTYYITTEKGGTTNIEEAGGTPTVTQTASQEQKQTPDYMQWLLLGGLGIAALYVFMNRRKG